MSRVKIRLSNCRSVKPFWAELDDVNSAWKNVLGFIQFYICKDDHISIKRPHHIINLHQLPYWKIDGYTIKSVYEKSRYSYKYFYGKRRARKLLKARYLVNTKLDHWAAKNIYPVPIPKVITSAAKLKDSSGINLVNKEWIENLLIDKCFGVYYNNTINYAKHIDGWRIHLHYSADMPDQTESVGYLDAAQFLRMIYHHWKLAIKKSNAEKALTRLISNSLFGWMSPYILTTSEFIGEYINRPFGKYIIRCTTSDMEYWKEIPLTVNEKCDLINHVKTFIVETGITPDTHISITFTGNIEEPPNAE